MIPSYLYHYTSVSTLIKILQSKRIRFNRLDLMNDPVEGHTSMFPDAKTCVFASCWTAESREELPMWKVYTNLEGCRLRMPIDMFSSEEKMSVVKCNKSNNYLMSSKLSCAYEVKRKKQPEISKNNFLSGNIYGPTSIEYYYNKQMLEENIVNEDKSQDFEFFEINLNLLGQRKLDYWKFEKEFRYRIFIHDAIVMAGATQVLNQGFANSPVITEFVDIPLEEKALNNIEVIMGPKTSPSDKESMLLAINDSGIRKYHLESSSIEFRHDK